MFRGNFVVLKKSKLYNEKWWGIIQFRKQWGWTALDARLQYNQNMDNILNWINNSPKLPLSKKNEPNEFTRHVGRRSFTTFQPTYLLKRKHKSLFVCMVTSHHIILRKSYHQSHRCLCIFYYMTDPTKMECEHPNELSKSPFEINLEFNQRMTSTTTRT